MYINFTHICIVVSSVLLLSCENKKLLTKNSHSNDTSAVVVDTVLLDWQEKLSGAAGEIRFFIENRIPNARYFLLDRELFSSVLIPRYYVTNNFTPMWFDKNSVKLDKVNEMAAYIDQLRFHGFEPNDYHLCQIKNLVDKIEIGAYTATDIANLDLFLSDAFFIIASHLYNGKVNPDDLKTKWGIQRGKPELRFDTKLSALLTKNTPIEAYMERFYPSESGYKVMIQKAIELNQIKENEIFLTIPLDSLDSDYAINTLYRSAIIKRLDYLGYTAKQEEDQVGGERLSKQIINFQTSHGLNADGKIGKHTYEALNESISEKIKKLYVNMERLRWLSISPSDTLVSINIADYILEYRKGYETLLNSRTVVGKGFRQTPVFESEISYLVFSPTWTIPQTILKNDVLPRVLKDTNYLNDRSMDILDRSGKKVYSNSINWKKALKGNFPYLIRQNPGPKNPLGRVKFMFPNKYSVYVHDTPSKSLFAKDERTFSSGCIRMQKPKELAMLLLNDTTVWSSEYVDSLMYLDTETTVVLKEPVKVSIYYLTAWIDANQNVQFRKDIYARDQCVYEALKELAPN